MARHHLQRFASPSPSVSLVIHLAGVATLAKTFQFLFDWDTPLAESHGWYFQFLTIIGLTLSLSVFTLASVADITGSTALFDLKNFVSIVATPLEVLVSTLYWGICAIDTALIVPPGYELPIWTDIGFHLAPAVLLTLDLILFSPPWTISGYAVMSLSTAFAFSYWYWVEMCFSKNGWYPYPMFELLTTSQRVLLFTVSAGLVTAFSSILKWVYGVVNGNEQARREALKPLKRVQ
ncbi:FAR-17a/AIG1-like protein [Metarhizium album ARSEF 1941]|uniref:FAR-17a/AIG1-like protein n=1 Tax=Metarhizium album (strain ARSEF 1941) TaxID=1081103 RepID=A0A0B2X419_METAS|nr:FAR-17a/AIG1-like protein [Metarhizium album ARSEF 1941]KHO00056.1 FAR-17a/AIG1-like protein [Metarhizium album ARSEF 1941]